MMDKKQFEEIFQNEYEKFKDEEKNINIYITGATGAGKSSLVNSVFDEELADTGIGQPVTQQTKKYKSLKSPFTLFDTKGYELGSKQHEEYLKEIEQYIARHANDEENQIHLIWYCISAVHSRVTDMDLELIQRLKNLNCPICVVLTKSDLVAETDLHQLQSILQDHNIPSFAVAATYINDPIFESHRLIEWSANNVDEAWRGAFLRSQKVDLDLLKKDINQKIKQHATGSFLVGFTPIPFSDAPVLLANQAAMTARILAAYNLEGSKETIMTLLKGLGVGKIVSSGGKYVVSQILKLLPGAGTVVGGLINGTVATSITLALGYSISEIGYQIKKEQLTIPDINLESHMRKYLNEENLSVLFKKYFQKEVNQ